MQETVSLLELIVAVIALLISIMGSWAIVWAKLASLQEKYNSLEREFAKQDKEQQIREDKLEVLLKEMQKELIAIRLKVEQKQDKE